MAALVLNSTAIPMAMAMAMAMAIEAAASSPIYLIVQAIVLLLATICVATWIWRWLLSTDSSCRGPPRWPLVGSYFEVRSNKRRIHDWVTEYAKLYKTFELRIGGTRMIHTADPIIVEYILKTKFVNYPKGKETLARQSDFLGEGIFNSDGEAWKRHRKIASYEFSSRKLRDFSSNIFKKNAIRLADILDSAVKSKQEVELQDLFMRTTLDSICELGFGLELGSLSSPLPEVPFANAFDRVAEAIAHRSLDLFWRIRRALRLGYEKGLQDYIRLLDAFTFKVIQQRKASIEQGNKNNEENTREDLLSRFMRFRDQDGEVMYKDKDLQDSILNFVLAGRDTTAITLSWLVYLLCNNPHVVDKISAELTSVVGDTKNVNISEFCVLLTPEHVDELHYLHAAVNEALRLYPPVPRDGKDALNDDVLPDGTKVKAGDRILYLPYSMGRMEFLWGNDALKFKPERWFKDNEFQSESPYKFSVFQAGPRMCLGKDSAYLQLKITAAVLIRFFQFKLVPNHTVHYRLGMVLQMINGIKVFVSTC
ncbi:hypothetical protein O6H91_10G081500 [Diphasiastrum complanatum]|uniref:Uncharacterized protein n=1 Tax=Diphasiastrum complanatum TaxID=34168 RepID=A0ACC2CIP4_DIPCM|nr:hypothetical protein O6H91_10G081500 [Diphasiastrum complanatum]